jgi:molybdopterin-guanine dinucleotide biosynthesis protein A
MGRDKALLDWHGQPLIEHMLGLLRAAGLTDIRISGERRGYAGIPDQRPDAGPVVGLLSVADTLDDGPALVLPVDMPRLDAALLRRLIVAPEAACVRFAEHALPMRLRLDSATRQALRETAASDGRQRSLRALQARIDLRSLPTAAEDASRLGNLNTPEDWQQAGGP